ncbi:DNA replication regulator SLD3-domain-containing protein [Aspergillus spinulosporus]
MASRESPNVLEPIPLNQLHDAIQPPLKKRKLSASNEWIADNIIIRAHAASLHDDPYVFEPIAVFPRLQLPLEWIEVPSALSQIQSGSLFVANIPALDSESQQEPVVVIVRLSSDGGIYVIERVKQGIYSLSKLARGVEEGDIRVALKASSRRANILAPCSSCKHPDVTSDGDWWRLAQVDDPAPDLSLPLPAKRAKVDFLFGISADPVDRDERMKGASPMDSMERSSSVDACMISVPPETQVPVQTAIPGGEVDDRNVCESTQTPQELLDGLREQYLQALYVSKASVAYFAKGPLPRCRAAFQAAESTAGNISELIDFYRGAILTAKKMDLKFRESLPATIQDIVLKMSDDEAEPKKRKSRKKSLGRNGLYPEEPDFIRKWWKNRAMTETGGLGETSRDAEIKKHVSDLRLRETQLQILLILETIALETAAADEAKKAGQEVAVDASQKPKSKKAQDLNVMLELHLDRLCIWHAVSFDEVPTSESQASGSAQQSSKSGNDAMRDFCTEVIIPFYASRLPDRCKSITRKLGVSASTIPALPKSTKKPRKEQGTVERNASNKSRRTLQRVLTDEQTTSHSRSQPSLNRSITAPSQIESKRETTPLLPTLNASVRGGIQKAKRAENREVDLFAVARQHETKLKRVQMLADQKRELDAAILALRKPNRELVAKDIAKDAEKRASSSRKPKNPVRNPQGQGVQVMATPSKVRKRDAVVGLPPLPKNMSRSKSKVTAASSSPFTSEPQVIPGSTIKPSSLPFIADAAVQETPSRRPPQPPSLSKDTTEPAVAETPIPGTGNLFRVPRRPASQTRETAPMTPVRSQHVDATEAITPLDGRHLETSLPPPPPPLFALPTKSNPSNSSMVFETPPKSKPAPGPVPVVTARRPSLSGPGPVSIPASAPKEAQVVPMTPEKSIYSALGWDDDDDLAL